LTESRSDLAAGDRSWQVTSAKPGFLKASLDLSKLSLKHRAPLIDRGHVFTISCDRIHLEQAPCFFRVGATHQQFLGGISLPALGE
jgi:hypothetical protein